MGRTVLVGPGENGMGLRLFNACRDYPELNGYSDEDCLRLMCQARARRGDAMWIVPLAIVGVMLLSLGGGATLAAMTAYKMRATAVGFFFDPVVRSIYTWALMAAGPGAVIAWIIVRRQLIMRSVLMHLVKARCPYCGFNLAGLKIELGAVTCPECGERVVLVDEGLTPDDLLPPQGRAFSTWRPSKHEGVELPPIPLEPEQAPERRKKIRSFGGKK